MLLFMNFSKLMRINKELEKALNCDLLLHIKKNLTPAALCVVDGNFMVISIDIYCICILNVYYISK